MKYSDGLKPVTRRKFLKISLTAGAGIMAGCSVRNRFDIIISGGQLIDGSGKPGRKLDLGIRRGRITALGDLQNASADHILDARERVVSPGFIDIHTHTDTELLVNPRAESKIRQGITTEVSGNCGYSPFPLTEEDSRELAERLQEEYGLPAQWTDISGFLAAIEKKGTALNYVTFTGHGNLRAAVVGKNDVAPTAEQLRRMKMLLQESMESGSFGLSTGLEYAPGSYAETDELIALCETVAQQNGLYSTHMRNEDDRVEEAIEEALQISRKSGVNLQISHLKACNQNNWHKVDHMLEMIHTAAEQGLPVAADRYPYNAWSTGLSSFLPLWARQGETEEVLERLRNPGDLPKIREYTEGRGRKIGGWERVVIANCSLEEHYSYEGKSIAECSEITSQEPFAFIRDLLIAERARVSVIGFAMNEDNLKKVLASPLVSIGSDGSAVSPYGPLGEGKPHPRFYGTFPRVLGKYCREEKVFDLPTAIHKITRLPARKLGLQERGELIDGYHADVVIFDPKTVIDKATFTNPHQYPDGIEYVIVNGKIVIDRAQHTDALPGQVIRHA